MFCKDTICPSCLTAQEILFRCLNYNKMAKTKKIRDKGKIKFSEYFKNLNEGDRVCITEEKAVSSTFPKRLQGRSGVVSGSKGKYKLIKLNDGKKQKVYTIHPIHLKKL